jgi:DNA-directed RNA polymerase subunit RPC12/RpoP
MTGNRSFTTQPAMCSQCGATDGVSYDADADEYRCADCQN